MSGVLLRGGNLDTETYKIYKRVDCVKIQNDHLQPKERGLEHILPSQPSEGTNPANTLVSEFYLTFRTMRNFCCLSHKVGGTLLWQP